MSQYKILAKDYEALNSREEIFKQQDFFRKIIARYAVSSCLDCACGTGWHLVMLNEMGLACCGSDLSPDMLALARENAKGRNIVLQEGDYRDLGSLWERKFDMIICMSNSIRHMLAESELRKALDSMYGQLNDGGILVVDNGLSDTMINERPKLLPGRILRDQAFYFILEYPNEREIVFNILNVMKTGDSFAHSFESMSLSSMKKADYDRCFAGTRFKKVSYFGDYQLSEFRVATSARYIAIAEK